MVWIHTDGFLWANVIYQRSFLLCLLDIWGTNHDTKTLLKVNTHVCSGELGGSRSRVQCNAPRETLPGCSLCCRNTARWAQWWYFWPQLSRSGTPAGPRNRTLKSRRKEPHVKCFTQFSFLLLLQLLTVISAPYKILQPTHVWSTLTHIEGENPQHKFYSNTRRQLKVAIFSQLTLAVLMDVATFHC